MAKTNLDRKIAAKFATVCSLHDLGVRMMEQNLARKHRGKTPQEIRGMVLDWLGHRPLEIDAQNGDAIRRKPVEAA